MVVDTILWNPGGVVYNFDLSIANQKLAAKSEKTPDEVFDTLFGTTIKNREFSAGLVEDYILGRTSSEEFFQQVKKKIQLKMPYDEFVEAWGNIFTKNTTLMQFMVKMQEKGVKQAILSSTNPIHWQYMNDMFDIEELIGRKNVILTCDSDAGFKKPTPELFEATVKRLGVDKSKIVYIDDIKRYTDGALDFGIGASIHVDLEQDNFQEKLIDDLKNLGFTLE